jgi:hypothetical protein
MGNQVSNFTSIDLLENSESLNVVLNATSPLYQTFKKGTTEFSPNWETMPDAQRPVIYPRVYSTMEAVVVAVTDIGWKYNSVAMVFDAEDGLCTYPDAAADKFKQIDYNGSKALKMVGNVASDANNDSDTITFTGKVSASGQTLDVSADITLLIEEASNNLYRMFLNMDDDVLDGDETQLSMTAQVFNNGTLVSSNIEYEFLDIEGNVLRAKNTSGTLAVTGEMINGQLMVVCKAYIGSVPVATEQRMVWDSKDAVSLHCDQGSRIVQKLAETKTYTYYVVNHRTGVQIPDSNVTYSSIKVLRISDRVDISDQFTIGTNNVVVPGAKIKDNGKKIGILVNATVEI